MATTFLEPGGDADFLVGTTNGFWATKTGAPSIVTDFVHGTHVKSIKYRPGGTQDDLRTAAGTLSDAGSRISFYLYINVLGSGTAGFLGVVSAGLIIRLKVTSSGILQLFNGSGTQLGSDGATLSTGTWYRISLAYTITSTTVNRFEVFVNGVSSISITNGTLPSTGSSYIQLGNIDNAANFDIRTSDHYIDNSSSLTDPGDIWVTAKRPNANGSANAFNTQIGAGGSGYGTGHSPQINERPLDTTNGWSITSADLTNTEEYTIESANVGDIDISTATIVDYLGWISADVDSTTASPVHHIIVAGTTTSKTMVLNTPTVFTQIAGSSTYPAGNTDIGMDARYTGTPHKTRLYECGIIVAYIPAAVTSTTTINMMMYT